MCVHVHVCIVLCIISWSAKYAAVVSSLDPPVVLAVVFYHVGCFIEYKLRIPDTARVFPVHAVW